MPRRRSDNNNGNNNDDRAIGVNISMPESLFELIDLLRDDDRSVFVREAISRYLETLVTDNHITIVSTE
jgi:metal-responsive CopG/Arc/MetJ family transcriptional regulator